MKNSSYHELNSVMSCAFEIYVMIYYKKGTV